MLVKDYRVYFKQKKVMFCSSKYIFRPLEWQLGTSPEAEDVFPPVKVGVNDTGSAAIIHGSLQLNEEEVNKTVSEFYNRNNETLEDMVARHDMAYKEKTFFYMEPGRCVFQTLHAIGWSHLKSKMKSKTVCIKRKDENDIHFGLYSSSRYLKVKNHHTLMIHGSKFSGPR